MSQTIQHYENFPVASVLCPAHLRAPIAAIYHFARTADDIADEGSAPASERLADLALMAQNLQAAAMANPAALPAPVSGRWPQVFEPLGAMIHAFKLPVQLLQDLLDAFTQDVIKTQDHAGYANQAELLDYCRRSANPIGRLLLHLYGVRDFDSLAMSDQICSALQLINFWQDLSVDIPRARYYLPQDDCKRHGVSQQQLQALEQNPNTTALIAEQVAKARTLMQAGLPLVHRVPGRAGWELRLVVQGGLRILDKIESAGFTTLRTRPKLSAMDFPVMLWRSLWM